MQKMKKQLIQSGIAFATIVATCMLMFMPIAVTRDAGIDLRTLDEVRRQPHLVTRLVEVTGRDSRYLEVEFVTSKSGFPSGPPIGVFDTRGERVDYTPDYGDAPSFHDRWHRNFRRMELKTSDLDRWPK